MSSEFFGPRGWLPLAATFALVIRAFVRSVLSWERRALKIDDYGFILESKGFCDFDHVSEHISLNILAELFVNGYLLYIFVQINSIYSSMEISRRIMNKSIKWQSKLIIKCTLFQSLAMTILYVGRMIDVITQEFFISRIVVSVVNSVSIYWIIVFPALIQCFEPNDQDTILSNEGIDVNDRDSDISSLTFRSETNFRVDETQAGYMINDKVLLPTSTQADPRTAIDNVLDYMGNDEISSPVSVCSLFS